MSEQQCPICERASTEKGIIYRTEYFTAFAVPDRPGWLLYAANRHVEWTWGLSDDEASAFGPFLKRVTAALKNAASTSHVYYFGFGENSLHFHGLLVARYEPFAKDVQAASALRGGEVADREAARKVADVMRELLAH